MTTWPFDTDLDSPISQVLNLRADGTAAVVSGPLDDVQRRSVVGTQLEAQLAEVVAQGQHDLIVIGGSAGGGKSMLIERLLEEHRDLFGEVVLDATHANAPSVDQASQLATFLAPFADDVTERPAGRPRLLAANTGMLIELFRQLGNRPFRQLERVLKLRLGIRRREGDEPETPWNVLVVNLDLRPTAGSQGFLTAMLDKLDFANPEGIAGGAPRCATCTVTGWCPVLANARLAVRSGAALNQLAAQAAMERGRHDSPRQLWDWLARLVSGDDMYAGYEDPCKAVAKAAASEHRAWVWERLLPLVLFTASGDVGQRVRSLDPSFRPTAPGHALMARAGIDPEADADDLGELLGDDLAEPLGHVRSGDVTPEAAGRAKIAASFLRDPSGWAALGPLEQEWNELLDEYGRFASDGVEAELPRLESLPGQLERALAAAFGFLDREIPYIPVSAYDPREQSRISVRLELDLERGSYEPLQDPAYMRNPEGAKLVGHRPQTLALALGGERSHPDGTVTGAVEVTLDLLLYRLLRHAMDGTLASTADLARFYGLRRAVEALSRRSAESATELLAEHPTTGQRFTVSWSRTLSGKVLKAQAVRP